MTIRSTAPPLQTWQQIPLQRVTAAQPGLPVPVTAVVDGLPATMNCTSSVTAGTILASNVVRTNEPLAYTLPAQACSYVYSSHLTPVVQSMEPREVDNAQVQVSGLWCRHSGASGWVH